jgi:4,5-DOPA dioxygenase extradiol
MIVDNGSCQQSFSATCYMDTDFSISKKKMPVVFVGHGSPMNAIEDNAFSRTWMEIGKNLPPVHAVLCISAHWETAGTKVTAMEKPETIHDFYGFPKALYDIQYPAPGSPRLAHMIRRTVTLRDVQPDETWGLDHGTWSVLRKMLPKADIPIVQLSLDSSQGPSFHYLLGKELRPLRNRGVLIIGSGNMVHNLSMMSWQEKGGYDWAMEFDETLSQRILAGDHESIIHYQRLGKAARLSVPTNEHYLPLLYILALQDAQDQVRFFADQVTLGSISMRSLWIE